MAGVLVLLVGSSPSSASAADTCANVQFRTGASAALPDCRAYEMVTPADKDANSLVYGFTLGVAAASGPESRLQPAVSGNRFFTFEMTSFADPHGANGSALVGVRDANGWQTTNIKPRNCRLQSAQGLTVSWFGYGSYLSADFSAALFTSPVTEDGTDLGCDPQDQAGKDVYRVGLDGSLTWVSQNGQPKTTDEDASRAAISADGTHALFTTPQLLLPQDAGRTTGSGLYDRAGGRTVAVGLKNDGTPVNACGATVAGDGAESWVVSRDNRVIFFQSGTDAATPGCTVADVGRFGQLYARIDASTTVELSASRLATPAARGDVRFLGATPDGRKVYFTSTERLTSGADPTGGLYEYDLTDVLNGSAATGSIRFLSPSVDGNPADVRRVLRVVGNGQQVYFLATGVLVNGVSPTGKKIYRSVDGQVQLVAQLASAAEANKLDVNFSSISLDGSKVVYEDQPVGQPYPQMYLVNGDGSGMPVCLSCPPAGTVASGPATLLSVALGGALRTFGENPFVTNDGRVFFGSPDRLAAGDRDDYYDVYEYRAGHRYLVTPGTDTADVALIAVGPDGRDVFFTTDSSLVAKDFDNGDLDVYDARVGGGFPAPPAPKIKCVGEECQPQVPAPTLAAPGSVAFVAPFAAPRATQAPKSSTKKVSVKRPKTVRGSTKVRLSVKAPEAGRIRVSGLGLKRAKKTAKKAKIYRVTVKLSKRSQRILRRKHQVKVRATVRFTPKRGKASRVRVHVTFKPKQHHAKAKRRSHDGAHRSARKGGR